MFVRVPEASPGSLWLDGHVAGATDARGTAGSRDGWHVTDITIWGLMGNVFTAPSLILVELKEKYILQINQRYDFKMPHALKLYLSVFFFNSQSEEM